MKKIFVIILAVSAFLASCSSPYYPEYVRVVSLGANTSSLMCENTEGEVELSVLSNVEYTATIISGSEWLSFKDTDALTRVGNGNEMIEFIHKQNNNGKRVARLVLAADTRRDTIKIKQYGRFEDFLTIHPDDKERFTLENGTRLPVSYEGGEVAVRLQTSCLDHELSAWTSDPTIVSGFKFNNGTMTFHVAANKELQPRIVTIQISYIDGWDDKRTLEISIRQDYDPTLADA
jgi:hypothetical protein